MLVLSLPARVGATRGQRAAMVRGDSWAAGQDGSKLLAVGGPADVGDAANLAEIERDGDAALGGKRADDALGGRYLVAGGVERRGAHESTPGAITVVADHAVHV